MRKVAVLTDSASDIPHEMQQQCGVDILSFYLTVDGKSYLERQDFTSEEYYTILAQCDQIPTTSQITMMRFQEQFCNYDDAGYTDVLYVSISGTGSSTLDAARMAVEAFREERPESKMRVYTVDSRTYSMAYGWYVCKAAQKIASGAEMQDVVAYLEDAFASVEIALSMYTLKFVKKSGRISAAAAFAGELMGLRPIIAMIDGKTETAAKVRGDANVMTGLVQYTKPRLAENFTYLVGTTDMENGKMLAKLCKKEFGKAPEAIFLLGAAVATNTGPNSVAIVFTGKDRRR